MKTQFIEICIPHEEDFNKEKFEIFMDEWFSLWELSYARSIVHPNFMYYSGFIKFGVLRDNVIQSLRQQFVDFSNKKQIRVSSPTQDN